MDRRPSYRTLATVCAGLFLPAGLLVGSLVSVYYTTVNPEKIDIYSNDLAYLGQVIISAAIVMLGLIIASIALMVAAYRQQKNMTPIKLPLSLLLVNLAVAVAIAMANGIVTDTKDKYQLKHCKPTADIYFKVLEENEKSNDDPSKKTTEDFLPAHCS